MTSIYQVLLITGHWTVHHPKYWCIVTLVPSNASWPPIEFWPAQGSLVTLLLIVTNYATNPRHVHTCHTISVLNHLGQVAVCILTTEVTNLWIGPNEAFLGPIFKLFRIYPPPPERTSLWSSKQTDWVVCGWREAFLAEKRHIQA